MRGIGRKLPHPIAQYVRVKVRSRAACATDTPRSRTNRTASSLNSRLKLRRPICHLRPIMTPKPGVRRTGSSSPKDILGARRNALASHHRAAEHHSAEVLLDRSLYACSRSATARCSMPSAKTSEPLRYVHRSSRLDRYALSLLKQPPSIPVHRSPSRKAQPRQKRRGWPLLEDLHHPISNGQD